MNMNYKRLCEFGKQVLKLMTEEELENYYYDIGTIGLVERIASLLYIDIDDFTLNEFEEIHEYITKEGNNMRKIDFTRTDDIVDALCDYNNGVRREMNTILEQNNYDFNDIEYIKKKERETVMSEIIQEIGHQYIAYCLEKIKQIKF